MSYDEMNAGARAQECASTGCESGRHPLDATAWEGLSGIARRTFLVQSALMTAAAMLAACGGADGGDVTSPGIDPTGTGGTTSSNVVTLASYPALASVGGVAMMTIGSARVALVRTSTSAFVALSRVCPHQGGIVNQSGSGFTCPVHGAQFSLTGAWTGGQRTSSLHAYTTAYDATAGTVTIT